MPVKDEGNGPGKRKKDTENTYKSYPDISEVLRTLRDVNQPPKKVSIQNSFRKMKINFCL